MFIDRSKDLRRKLADGKTLDEAFAELLASGASILECIHAVHRVQGWELIEAKKIVHFSKAWADMREAHDKFHQELEEIAKQIGDENA